MEEKPSETTPVSPQFVSSSKKDGRAKPRSPKQLEQFKRVQEIRKQRAEEKLKLKQRLESSVSEPVTNEDEWIDMTSLPQFQAPAARSTGVPDLTSLLEQERAHKEQLFRFLVEERDNRLKELEAKRKKATLKAKILKRKLYSRHYRQEDSSDEEEEPSAKKGNSSSSDSSDSDDDPEPPSKKKSKKYHKGKPEDLNAIIRKALAEHISSAQNTSQELHQQFNQPPIPVSNKISFEQTKPPGRPTGVERESLSASVGQPTIPPPRFEPIKIPAHLRVNPIPQQPRPQAITSIGSLTANGKRS